MILPIENVTQRINRIHDSHNKEIKKAIRMIQRYAKAHHVNIKIIVDGGGQGIGKTTHWIRESINNTWITIVLVSTHFKAVEILKDLETWSDESISKNIKPKLKYNFQTDTLRVHTMYSRYWELNEDDWYVSPQFEGMECLCILFRENPVIFKMLKDGHLNNYCRQDDVKNVFRCKYRFGCVYSAQLPEIINQIKGDKWQLISNSIRHRNTTIIEDKINLLNKFIKFLNSDIIGKQIKKQVNTYISSYVKRKYPKLIIKFEKETGKHAIWRNRVTNIFISWINKQIKVNKLNKIEIQKEERNKIHHVIILPHIYLFLSTITKIFNTFDDINVIIDENNIDLIYEQIKITRGRVYNEIKFFNDNKRELINRGVNLKIYDKFKPIINLLNNKLKYSERESTIIERLKKNVANTPYNSRAQEFERQALENYKNKLDDDRSLLLSDKLIEFVKIFDETNYLIDYTNYINGILNYNKENYNNRKPQLLIPDNLFAKIYKLLLELKSLIDNNTETIDTKIDVNIGDGVMEFKINRMASLNNLIESVSKFVVFADATARQDIYKKVLGQENKFYYMRYDNISNYDIYYAYPSNGKLNAKYQLWDNENNRFTNDGYNLIERVVWLIKLERIEKIYITIYGVFNNWQRRDYNILDGLIMRIIGNNLRIRYNIDIKELDILLCFRYADSGKDLFKDRTIEIQFGCAGITARGTKRYMSDHDLSKAQVDYIKIAGEQEQTAGRCRGFKHQSPVRHYLLTSKISSKFKNVKDINIILKNRDIIDYIEAHGEMSARQIQHDLRPDRELSNLIPTMLKLADANIGLRYRDTSANLRVWYFLKN